jgi:hypothetical protein
MIGPTCAGGCAERSPIATVIGPAAAVAMGCSRQERRESHGRLDIDAVWSMVERARFPADSRGAPCDLPGNLAMNRFASGAAGAIAAAMSTAFASAALEPMSLARILDLEVSITAGWSRTFAYDGGWFDAERSLVDHAVSPVGRAPGGFVQAFGSSDGDLIRFGWTSPVGAKYASGSGTLFLRLLVETCVAETFADSASVSFLSGGRPIDAGTMLDPGLHRIAWTLTGPSPSGDYGGGLRLVAASSAVPLPGAVPAAALLLAGGLPRRRRRA